MWPYKHGGDIYTNKHIKLDFSVSTNPLGMPPRVKQALLSNISSYENYPDPLCRDLRKQLAIKHKLDTAMILSGNGASELIMAICAYLKPQQVLIPAPTFSEYERSALLYGSRVSYYFLAAPDFDFNEDILDKLTPDVDILFLCNPNNPTGKLINPVLLDKIVKLCLQNQIYLVLDECFIDFTSGESLLIELKSYPHLLILQAFTKIYSLAGLRLGTLFSAQEDLLPNIAAYLPPWNVSAAAQVAGIAALTEKDWLEKTKSLVAAERSFLTTELSELGLIVFPSEANFLLLKSEKNLYELLLRQGILVRSGANFPGLNAKYFRIGLKTRNQNQILINTIKEVLNG